jgi:hypothetical protein
MIAWPKEGFMVTMKYVLLFIFRELMTMILLATLFGCSPNIVENNRNSSTEISVFIPTDTLFYVWDILSISLFSPNTAENVVVELINKDSSAINIGVGTNIGIGGNSSETFTLEIDSEMVRNSKWRIKVYNPDNPAHFGYSQYFSIGFPPPLLPPGNSFWILNSGQADSQIALQIIGNTIYKWVNNSNYTYNNFFENLDSKNVMVKNSLLLASKRDSLFLLKNNQLLQIQYDTGYTGPSGIMRIIRSNLLYYSLYQGSIPPSGWPALRSDYILFNSVQGKWILTQITTLTDSVSWNLQNPKYELVINDSNALLNIIGSSFPVISCTLKFSNLALFLSSDFHILDSLEKIKDTLYKYPGSSFFNQGTVSNSIDTIEVINSMRALGGGGYPNDLNYYYSYLNTYCFVKEH